jgi:glycosyltransferase involved in cell wall biosynthesis
LSVPRVCFFVGDISLGGGTERAVATIASGLAERGWKVLIVSMHHQSPGSFFPLHPSIQIEPVLQGKERMRWRPLQTLRRIRHIAKSFSPQQWVDGETVLTMFSAVALYGLSFKHLSWENFHLHENLGSAFRTLARSVAAHRCDGVIVLTQADRSAWLKKFGQQRAIHQIPHCVQAHGLGSEHPVPARQPIVLTIGRHTYQKGYDLLLKAWARVGAKHTEWRLRIVGSGELTEELTQLAGLLGIAEQVEWVPHTREVEAHYQEASVFALSSRFEGFGIVLIEALSLELPVVSFRCHHGPEEIIEDKVSGRLVENGRVDLFAQALDDLMSKPDERQRMASAARLRSAKFAPSLILDQWERVLAT